MDGGESNIFTLLDDYIDNLDDRGQRGFLRHVMKVSLQPGQLCLTSAAIGLNPGVPKALLAEIDVVPADFLTAICRRVVLDSRERARAATFHMDDPAMRIATGVRLAVKRAADDPLWGRFTVRIALNHFALPIETMVALQFAEDVGSSRFRIRPDQAGAAAATVICGVTNAKNLVITGQKDWQTAGSDAAEQMLVAFGLYRYEAREIARAPLPNVPAVLRDTDDRELTRFEAGEVHP